MLHDYREHGGEHRNFSLGGRSRAFRQRPFRNLGLGLRFKEWSGMRGAGGPVAHAELKGEEGGGGGGSA